MSSNLLKSISDEDLLRRLSGLVQESRRVESELIAHIAEVDERRLYAREACSSMFCICRRPRPIREFESHGHREDTRSLGRCWRTGVSI